MDFIGHPRSIRVPVFEDVEEFVEAVGGGFLVEAGEFAVAHEVVAVAGHLNAVVADFEEGEAEGGGGDFDAGEGEEIEDGGRHAAEAVGEFGVELGDGIGVGEAGDAAVDFDAEGFVFDIPDGEAAGGEGVGGGGAHIEEVEADFNAEELFGGEFFEVADALFEELAVEVEADVGDVSAL